MKRRTFIQALSATGALGFMGPHSAKALVPNGYTGPLLLQVQADGGWDVTSYCDPKTNQPGAPIITNWSKSGEPGQAGGITYAPFANNDWFFKRHHQRMMVINGIDLQTNSHTTGVLHNWSGRNAEGYPSLTALFAAHHAPDVPMPYINFGGFGATENVIGFTRLQDNPELLKSVLDPNLNFYHRPNEHWDYEGPINLRRTEDLSLIQHYRSHRQERLASSIPAQSRELSNLNAYIDAVQNREPLRQFSPYLPDEEDTAAPIEMMHTNLKAQVQIISAAFAAGVTGAADLQLGGFDTHDKHDDLHAPLLTYLNESIDLIWQLAEQGGYADRLTVVIGSDFSRTPHYNSQDGKDHWPIGSVIVMQDHPTWGSQSVGFTDEGHNALRIDPATMLKDLNQGTILYPKHIHQTLRRLTGLKNTDLDSKFPFRSTPVLPIFDA
jgi:hypothetical protein